MGAAGAAGAEVGASKDTISSNFVSGALGVRIRAELAVNGRLAEGVSAAIPADEAPDAGINCVSWVLLILPPKIERV